jgi:hypothetical protein
VCLFEQTRKLGIRKNLYVFIYTPTKCHQPEIGAFLATCRYVCVCICMCVAILTIREPELGTQDGLNVELNAKPNGSSLKTRIIPFCVINVFLAIQRDKSVDPVDWT